VPPVGEVELLEADALRVDFRDLVHSHGPGKLRVVGNLPTPSPRRSSFGSSPSAKTGGSSFSCSRARSRSD
jgi:hypothetical protein